MTCRDLRLRPRQVRGESGMGKTKLVEEVEGSLAPQHSVLPIQARRIRYIRYIRYIHHSLVLPIQARRP